MYRKRPQPLDDSSVLAPYSVPFTIIRNEARKTRKKVNYNELADDTAVVNKGSGRFLGVRLPADENILAAFKPIQQSDPVRQLGMNTGGPRIPRPLHDPSECIVLYDPTDDSVEQNSSDPSQTIEESDDEKDSNAPLASPPKKGLDPLANRKSLMDLLGISKPKAIPTKVPVVIDPKLGNILRPHQIEGVQFLYKCTTGMLDPNAHGCIMADEMGLGKTLQCIALLWTLLRQSPEAGKPTIEKCVIICPSSLVRNWANELVKWLGKGTVNALAADGKSIKSGDLPHQIRNWAEASGRQVTRPVLIISYETLRLNIGHLDNCEIGLVLADEGHRLKNGDNQTFTALNSLNAKRRVILTGTPIQNDLTEYYSLISFANPGLLGTPAEFKRNFERYILKGRDAFALDKDVQKGEEKLAELLAIVNRYIIRRTNDILSKYLPVKYEHVVFCDLSPLQRALYQQFTSSSKVANILDGEPGEGGAKKGLLAIGTLRKLCMHPDLINLPKEIPNFRQVAPGRYKRPENRGRDKTISSEWSCKFEILERMLFQIKADTSDKIVIISNFTSTLDIVAQMCRQYRYEALRLDGTMAISKRQNLVDKFNDPNNPAFIFLLSSKAGGCGINLIGANRLILLDPDWNPASDQQALARVWRDGQKKNCYIYRFIATGTIEENIFQRQSMKQTLSSCVVDDNKDAERLFSYENLRKLFEYNDQSVCATHDTFKCKRCNEMGQIVRAPAHLYGDATTWNHFTRDQLKESEDQLLRTESAQDKVSFVFQYISH